MTSIRAVDSIIEVIISIGQLGQHVTVPVRLTMPQASSTSTTSGNVASEQAIVSSTNSRAFSSQRSRRSLGEGRHSTGSQETEHTGLFYTLLDNLLPSWDARLGLTVLIVITLLLILLSRNLPSYSFVSKTLGSLDTGLPTPRSPNSLSRGRFQLSNTDYSSWLWSNPIRSPPQSMSSASDIRLDGMFSHGRQSIGIASPIPQKRISPYGGHFDGPKPHGIADGGSGDVTSSLWSTQRRNIDGGPLRLRSAFDASF
ncbi:unnamed protein product [Protopolystoma xenopodis]|uniref:Uncharacterized protein n=1 Tax=Protopolystoma xenopodis TaxID=117903 RepID=A0A448WMY1_9PLAT|nr:unnamed protein product [Protopolystoma xenopodis]